MAARAILRSVVSRLLGTDYQGNIVFRGRYIYYGDDSGSVPAGTIDCLALGPLASGIVSVTDATPGNGPLDDYDPTGYVAGTTNRLLLAASADPTGTTIDGILSTSVADGFEIFIAETAGLGSLIFPHLAAGSAAGNRFSNQNGGPMTIPPLGCGTIKYTVNKWKFT